MARYTGAVRFSDGEVLYFVYEGTTDIAMPRLFGSDGEATQWWGIAQSTIKPTQSAACEEVEVMPYYGHGDTRVMFQSKADRLQMLITGARSLEDAVRLAGESSSPYD